MIDLRSPKKTIQTLDFVSKSHGINADYAKHNAARITDLRFTL